MRNGRPDGVVPMFSRQPVVPAPDGTDGTARHLRHRFAAGKPDSRWLVLDTLPQLVLAELAQRASGPVTIAALHERLLDQNRAAVSKSRLQGLGSLAAAAQRRGDDGAQRQGAH